MSSLSFERDSKESNERCILIQGHELHVYGLTEF